MTAVRPVERRTASADDAVWRILEPTIRAGETWAIPRDWTRGQALAFWFGDAHEVWLAERHGDTVGTYYLRAAGIGGGSHVANAGYMVLPDAMGQGIASAMCEHSIARARERGFRSFQFNYVVSTNERAVRLWRRHGFEVIGQAREAFRHPTLGYVDVLLMRRDL